MTSIAARRILLSSTFKRTTRITAPIIRIQALRSRTFGNFETAKQTSQSKAFSTSPVAKMSGTEGKKGVHNIGA